MISLHAHTHTNILCVCVCVDIAVLHFNISKLLRVSYSIRQHIQMHTPIQHPLFLQFHIT